MIEHHSFSDFSAFVYLFTPAIDWIAQCLAYKADEQSLVDVLNVTARCNSAPLLNAIMASFPPQYLSARLVSLRPLSACLFVVS